MVCTNGVVEKIVDKDFTNLIVFQLTVTFNGDSMNKMGVLVEK